MTAWNSRQKSSWFENINPAVQLCILKILKKFKALKILLFVSLLFEI
jgi:hypothetical protein